MSLGVSLTESSNKRSPSRWTWAFVALALVLLSSACSSRPPSRIRVAYIPVTDSLQVIAAREMGYFTKAGLNVELISVPNGAKAIETLSAGSVEIAFANLATVFSALGAGVGVKIVCGGSLDTSAHEIHGLLVGKESDIAVPSQLASKTIAIPIRRSIDYAFLLAYLKKYGLSDTVVRITEVPFPQMDGVLRAGTVDAVATAEPYLTQSLMSGDSKLLSYYFAEVSPRVIIAAYVAKADWLAANREVASRFTAAMGEATRYLNANPVQARELVRKYIRISDEVAMKMTLTTFAESFSRADLETLADFLYKYGVTTTRISAGQLIGP